MNRGERVKNNLKSNSNEDLKDLYGDANIVGSQDRSMFS